MASESDKLLENIKAMLGDNPEETVSRLLGSLSLNTPNTPPSKEQSEAESSPLDVSAILKLQNALNGGNEDDSTRLLAAIKPFLNDRRKPQVDKLLKILKLANVAQKAGGADLLKNLKL